MSRYVWNAFFIAAIGTGFYFYVQLVFSKVTDPLHVTLAILLGSLFGAGFLREIFGFYPADQENSQS